jgi:hypothetical protein
MVYKYFFNNTLLGVELKFRFYWNLDNGISEQDLADEKLQTTS